MSKELQTLKYVIQFYKCLIKELNYLNFITKTIDYDYKIEQYQNKLYVMCNYNFNNSNYFNINILICIL